MNWPCPVTNTPILNFTNLQDQVVLPTAQSQSFYRLKTPWKQKAALCAARLGVRGLEFEACAG
jgi:hypothetical protein